MNLFDWFFAKTPLRQRKSKKKQSHPIVKKAKEFLPERTLELAIKMNLYPKKITIRMQKTRWGSCSSRGNISLNARLMYAPLWVIDSVIIHELAHLQHMNHSKAFWALVKEHCPEYEKANQWLRAQRPLV